MGNSRAAISNGIANPARTNPSAMMVQLLGLRLPSVLSYTFSTATRQAVVKRTLESAAMLPSEPTYWLRSQDSGVGAHGHHPNLVILWLAARGTFIPSSVADGLCSCSVLAGSCFTKHAEAAQSRTRQQQSIGPIDPARCCSCMCACKLLCQQNAAARLTPSGGLSAAP